MSLHANSVMAVTVSGSSSAGVGSPVGAPLLQSGAACLHQPPTEASQRQRLW
jgi:hypothetical protein